MLEKKNHFLLNFAQKTMRTGKQEEQLMTDECLTWSNIQVLRIAASLFLLKLI